MVHHGRRGSTRRDNWARLAARLACLYRCSKLALRAGSDQERSHSPSLVLADASAQVAAVLHADAVYWHGRGVAQNRLICERIRR